MAVCANFPGIWTEPWEDIRNYAPCRCKGCRAEWPCPLDLKLWDYVEVAEPKSQWRGRVVAVGLENEHFWFATNQIEPPPPIHIDVRTRYQNEALWRRVVIPSRFDRDVL